ncbi:MAG: hypothetical protein IKF68_01390 [Erysipelotrichaceae bacterium]|nr:hypothetical protein [Erysipelotrichaceae bacterium]
MRKTVLLSICITLMFLFGCNREKEEGPKINVSFRNEVKEADIWIIEDTEANRKTTVWGKAHIAKLPENQETEVSIKASEDGNYLFRMIDKDHMFYASETICLKDHYSLRIYKEDLSFCLEICDEQGNVTETQDLFAGRL